MTTPKPAHCVTEWFGGWRVKHIYEDCLGRRRTPGARRDQWFSLRGQGLDAHGPDTCGLCALRHDREAHPKPPRSRRRLPRTAKSRGATASERFWASVNKTDCCWLWTAGLSSVGYGRLRVDGRLEYAHRFAYRLLVGDIARTDQVDHLCHVRHCVNPSHLRAAGHTTNQRNRKGANRNSKSGIRGVRQTESGTWMASAKLDYKMLALGTYSTAEEAGAAVFNFWASLPAPPTEPCAYGWSDTHFHRCAEDVRPVAAGDGEGL